MPSGWTYTFKAAKSPTGMQIIGRAYLDRVVSTLADGEEFNVTISEHQEKRSNAQNRANWGPILDQALEAICAHEGYRRDEWPAMKLLIHEGLTGRYQGYDICPVTKKEIRKFRTSKATTKEMAAYFEWLAQFLAEEYHYVLTLPGEAA